MERLQLRNILLYLLTYNLYDLNVHDHAVYGFYG